MVRKYCRHNKSINTTECMDYYRQTITTQWEGDEDDTVEEDDDITKAGFEITTTFREKEVAYLVQVFLHGR